MDRLFGKTLPSQWDSANKKDTALREEEAKRKKNK
jgi:hypothetical protein